MEDKNPIQVADRLFGALEYLSSHGPVGLTEIAQELDLNKSTTHRVVASLIYMGYVKQNEDNGKYELTFKIVDLATTVMDKINVIGIVRPYLRKLMEKSGETVHFVKMEGTNCVYIDKEESDRNTVRMVSHIGSAIPFYRSAVGKALAADMPAERVKKLWNQCDIQRMTAYTITDFDDFMESLEEIRKKGYALDNEENEVGVRCIGTSLDIGVDKEYAISISVPISRMDNDRIRVLSEDILSVKKEIESMYGTGREA